MARTIHADYPVHAGIDRVTRGFGALAALNTTRAALHALAFVGSPVTRLAGKARTALSALAAERRQRREDQKLWNVALQDARVMADLSRAMSQEASRASRYY